MPAASSHVAYLSTVTKASQKAARTAAVARGRAIQRGRGQVAMGADPVSAAAAVPSASPMTVLTPPVVAAVTAAFQDPSNPVPTTAVIEGVRAATAAVTGVALDAQRAAQAHAALPGFDAGVALVKGAAQAQGLTPGLGPQHTAGWLVTHGLAGAPSEIKVPVIQIVTGVEGMKEGAAHALKAVKKGVTPAVQIIKAQAQKVAGIVSPDGTHAADLLIDKVDNKMIVLLVGGAIVAAGAAGIVGYLLLKKWTVLWIGLGLAGAAGGVAWVCKPDPNDPSPTARDYSAKMRARFAKLVSGPHATAATASVSATAAAGPVQTAATSATSSKSGVVGPHAAAAAGGVTTPATSAAG